MNFYSDEVKIAWVAMKNAEALHFVASNGYVDVADIYHRGREAITAKRDAPTLRQVDALACCMAAIVTDGTSPFDADDPVSEAFSAMMIDMFTCGLMYGRYGDAMTDEQDDTLIEEALAILTRHES